MNETDNSEIATELAELATKKLWHQLTMKFLSFLNSDAAKDADIVRLYKRHIAPNENKLNPYSVVEIISHVVKREGYHPVAIKFLVGIEDKVKCNILALMFCKLLQAEIYSDKMKNYEKCREVVNELEPMLNGLDEISAVHGRFYLIASKLYKWEGKHTEYYRNCLKYLGSVDLESLDKDQKIEHAFLLSLALLLSDDLYNFGELLQHPIINSLKDTSNEWVIELLGAFNDGDMKKFEELEPYWSLLSDVKAEEAKLRRKVVILCLVNMAFEKPITNRTLTFEEVARGTNLPVDEVELLVMRAMSLGLVKGRIDEVAQEIRLTWIMPRVLTFDQIKASSEQLREWSKVICGVSSDVSLDSDLLT